MKTTIFSKTTIGALAVCSLLLSACRGDGGFDYDHSALYVSGTDENPVVKFVVEDTPASYAVTVQSTEKVASDVKLLMAIDRSKVAEYNEANKTNYFAIPEGAVELENPEVVISEGNAISSAATVRVLSTEQFEEGCTYMVPVTIKGISGSMMNIIEGSRTIFLRISRVLNFAAVNADYNASSNFIFENAIPLTTFTYEMKIYPTGLANSGPQRFCALEQADESKALLLRFNEANTSNKLQVMTPYGTLMSNTEFANNQWYLLSIVWDGTNLLFYVNGVLDNSLAGKDPDVINFQRFEMGMSWGGYNSRQFFGHRFCEFRVWDRALSASEILGGLCGVAANSNGLQAYWKFNEGTGHVFHDATGHGFDMDWKQTSRAIYEGDMLPTPDAYKSIKWVKDDINKCAQ